MATYADGTAEHFATTSLNILPRYRGPLVTIKLTPTNREFILFKDLLCAESRVFQAMFDGNFREAREMTVELQEMEGVVSVRSVQALSQWLYHRVVKFDAKDKADDISAAIEFARFADKYDISGLQAVMAQYIKKLILANSDFTVSLSHDNIVSANHLPRGHTVRQILAKACVGGYFALGYKFKFAKEIQECPFFAADLIVELRSIMITAIYFKGHITFLHPLSGKEVSIKKSF